VLKTLIEGIQKLGEKITIFLDIVYDFFTRKFGLTKIPKTDSVHTKKDYQMIDETRKIVKKYFGKDVYTTIDKLKFEHRFKLCDLFIEELKQLYGFDVKVTYYCDEKSLEFGCYNDEENCIYLNATYLLAGTRLGMETFVKSIIHEMRHKIQCIVLSNAEYWDTPQETKDNWSCEYKDYISSDKDYELYYKQLIEKDARSFSEKSMEV
jgi:hypothetical protein